MNLSNSMLNIASSNFKSTNTIISNCSSTEFSIFLASSGSLLMLRKFKYFNSNAVLMIMDSSLIDSNDIEISNSKSSASVIQIDSSYNITFQNLKIVLYIV